MKKVLLAWRDISLEISPQSIYSFSDVSMQFGIKTKNVTQAGQECKNLEAIKAQGLNLEIPLIAEMGVNVEDTIKLWRDRAQDGIEGHIYIAGHDLIGKSMILVSCDVSKIRVSVAADRILGATLKLKFERKDIPPLPQTQAAGGGGGGGGKKAHYIYTTSPEIRSKTEAWLKKHNMKVPSFNGVPLPPKQTRGSHIPDVMPKDWAKTHKNYIKGGTSNTNKSKSNVRKKGIMNRVK